MSEPMAAWMAWDSNYEMTPEAWAVTPELVRQRLIDEHDAWLKEGETREWGPLEKLQDGSLRVHCKTRYPAGEGKEPWDFDVDFNILEISVRTE